MFAVATPSWRACAALCVGLWVLSISTAAAATADAATAFAAGAANVRLLEDALQPGICSVVLERQRCRDDRQTLRSYSGDPNLYSEFDNWLVTGDATDFPRQFNGMGVMEQAWRQAPAAAFWYVAGALVEAAPLPRASAFQDFSDSMVTTLRNHQTDVPDEFRALLTGAQTDPLTTLVPAVEQSFPVTEFPQIRLSQGSIGAAQLGAYFSSLMELIDVPIGMSRPESRLFGADVLHRVDALHAQYSDGKNSAALEATLAAAIPADAHWIDAHLRQPLSEDGPTTKWPAAVRSTFLLGELVAQLAFNAAAIKDAHADESFRGAIPELLNSADVSRQIRHEASLLASIPQGDLQDVSSAATRLTLEIIAEP